MTKLRIKTLHPMGRVDYTHIRHFHMALLRSPRAEVTQDPAAEVDFTFGGHPDPRNGKRISYTTHDPHGLPGDFDPRPLISQARLALLTGPEQDCLRRSLEGTWAQINATGHSILKVMESLKIDLLVLGARWPFRQCLAPKLRPPTQLMRCSLSVPEAIFYCAGSESRDVDAFFMGGVSIAHPVRLRMIPELRAAGDIHFVEQPVSGTYIHNTWPTPGDFDQHQLWYANWLRRTKIAPLDGSVWDWPTSRYFEAMACGALVIAPIPHDGDILGFRDGETMVATDGWNLMDRVRYYLEHEEERAKIAAAGAELVRKHHTCAARADQMIERLERFKAGESAAEIEADFDARLL